MRCEIAEDAPASVRGDSRRVRQVLVNLIENAVKFTDRGSVVVSLRTRPAPGNRVELVFAVRDTGEGIPAGELDKIFHSFYQGTGPSGAGQ